MWLLIQVFAEVIGFGLIYSGPFVDLVGVIDLFL